MAHVHPPTPSPNHPTSSLSFGFGAGPHNPPSRSNSPMHHQPVSVGFGSFKRPAFAPPLQHSFALPPPQSPSTPLGTFSPAGTSASPGSGYFSQHQQFGSSPLKQRHQAFFHQPTTASNPHHQPQPQSSNPRRRGREDDDEGQGRTSVEDFAMDGSAAGGSGSNQNGGGSSRVMRGMKKSRVISEEGQAGSDPGKTGMSGEGSKEGEVDVGVLLALLPQSSLLPILSSLLQLHPSLKPDLLKLIPTPSISTALDALRVAETKVKEAVPFGWSKEQRAGGLSESYVLGRINGPVGELAAQISSHLPFFTSNPTPPHPSQSYPYLHACTTLLLSLSSSLPSPLHPLSIFWPRLAEQWLLWVGRVSQLVNQEGGMVGSGAAEGWIKGLDELAFAGRSVRVGGSELEERIVEEMGVVRARWIGEVGWLVGRRIENNGQGQNGGGHQLQLQQQPQPQHDMMEEEEEL